MPSGIRATVEFTAGDVCPIAEFSARADTTVDSVAANVTVPGCEEHTTEFSTDAEAPPDADVEQVFSHGARRHYRLSHEGDLSCPCEYLGQFGCPVARYVAREGRLTLVFHAVDYDQLRTIVTGLRERFPGVDVKRFVRSPAVEQSEDGVLVDRSRLTDRQVEVLETAHEMGYFERPRRANATEIADELGINPSTFREHLVAAEWKILDDLL